MFRIFIVTFFALLLSACGGGGSKNTEVDSPPVSTPAPTPTPEPAAVTTIGAISTQRVGCLTESH